MSERIKIEVANSRGFRDSNYTRVGLFVGLASNVEGYDGGGYDRFKGIWIVMSDAMTGELFAEPIHRCKEVSP